MWFWHVTLRRGARGPAVADVRRRLFRLGHLPFDGGSEFDEACQTAVVALQTAHNLQPDGIVGPATWSALYGQISYPVQRRSAFARSVWARPRHVGPSPAPPSRSPSIAISVAERTLTLCDEEGSTRIFPVAVGRPLSPTPAGRFTVSELVRNPGGALGVRWLRLHPGTCSIHGTDEPWTIGADVTPGCVRLYNKDVEIVFDRVRIGTLVTIA